MQKKSKTGQKPRRYLRSLITRKLILDAAQETFQTKGYAKATITRISTNANVGYGTVYSHFKGKNDLLKAITDRSLDEFYQLLEAPCEPTTYDEARQIFFKTTETFFRLAKQQHLFMQVFREALRQSAEISHYWEAIQARLIATIMRLLSIGRQHKLARPVDPETAARASVLLIERFLWVVVREETEAEEVENLAAFLTGMVFEGFFIKPA